jgi:hypothetical protein
LIQGELADKPAPKKKEIKPAKKEEPPKKMEKKVKEEPANN